MKNVLKFMGNRSDVDTRNVAYLRIVLSHYHSLSVCGDDCHNQLLPPLLSFLVFDIPSLEAET